MKITNQQIQSYLDNLLPKHQPSTINRHRSLWSGIYRRAIDWGYCKDNPVKRIKPKKESNIKTEFLSKDNIIKLLESARKDSNIVEEDKVCHILTFHEMLNNPLYRSLYKRLTVKAVDGWARVKRNAAPGIVGQALLRVSRDTGMESYLKKICSPACYQMLRSKGQVTANMAARMLQKIGKRKDTDGYFHVQIDAPFGLKFRTFEYYFGEQTSGLNPWGSLDACEFDETDIIHMSKSVTGKQCGPGCHTSLRAKRLTLSQVMGF